jgi:hypothetical protein
LAKTKTKDKAKCGLQVRRVKDKKERQTGGFFMRLKTDEWMKAYALFIPDPEAENNSGYFEYFEHYDKPNNQYVPCAGDDCYMCELGNNPSVRALTLWYFPDNENGQKLKVLKLNGYMIRDFAEIQEEEGGVMGRRFRIKRLSDKGEYRVSPQQDKPLTKAVIKELLKSAAKGKDENTASAIDFEALTLRQLKAALEKNDAVSSLTDDDDEDDDDDDDDEDVAESSKKGKEKGTKKKDEEDDDDENDDDEDEEDDDEEDDDEEEEEDDDDSDDDDDDEDDDDDDDEEESESESESEDEEDEEIKGQKFTVVSTSERDETITVKIDGKNAKLWLAEGVDADWDVVKKGAEITVNAVKDDEGDWLISSLKSKKAKEGKKEGKGKGKKK